MRGLARIIATGWTAATLAAAAPVPLNAQTLFPTWFDITPPHASSVSSLALHPLDGRRLVVGHGDQNGPGALSFSDDVGTTWNASPSPATSLQFVQELFAHPGRPGVLYLHEAAWSLGPAIGFFEGSITRGRMFVSNDFGATWKTAYDGRDGPIMAFASDPLDPSRVLGTLRGPNPCCRLFAAYGRAYGVAASRDDGTTWMASSSGLPDLPAADSQLTARAATRSAPTRMFFSPNGAYVSMDSGATWKLFPHGYAGRLLTITPDPARANVLYAVGDDADHIGRPVQLVRSDDNGATWRTLLPFLRADERIPVITVDPARPDDVWLWNLIDGIYHSVDRGEHWSTVGSLAGLFAADVDRNAPFPGRLDVGMARLYLSPSGAGVAYVIWKGRLYRGARLGGVDPVIVEFEHEADRYWVATTQGEALSQDYRMEPGNAHRTELRFGAWRADDAPAGALGSCRFWSRPGSGLRTRVITLKDFECEILKRDPGWILEAENEFFALPPNASGACAGGSVPVHRFHNTKADLNHRWVADAAVAAEMRARGWYDEGVRFCARPLGSNE